MRSGCSEFSFVALRPAVSRPTGCGSLAILARCQAEQSGRSEDLRMVEGLGSEAWASVWSDVARRLGEHRAAGRRHLLTEDTVRMCTVLALEKVGVSPNDMGIEVYDSILGGGKVDLVVTGDEGRTVIELKYPRASTSGMSADTMTLGELIRDFLRVAIVPAADRWVVTVLEPELRRYLSRREDLRWTWERGQSVVMEREALEALPKTARDAIGSLAWLLPVQATCVVSAAVDVDLALFAYQVEQPAQDGSAAPLVALDQAPVLTSASGAARQVRPGTAREEILAAIRGLASRSGRSEVTVQQVVDEVRRGGSSYAESTVRTMLTSHMCAQVHGPNIGSYDDVDRVDRGTYRLRPTAG